MDDSHMASLAVGQAIDVSWSDRSAPGWVRWRDRRALGLGVDHPDAATLELDHPITLAFPAPRGLCRVTSRLIHVETAWRTIGSVVMRSPSTLVLSAPTMMDFEQRRRFVRIPCQLPIEVRVGRNWLQGRCRCLSAGGLSAELSGIVADGEEVRVRFGIPDGEIRTEGVVLRSDPKRYAPHDRDTPAPKHIVAIAFLALRRIEDQLAHYIFEQQRRAASPEAEAFRRTAT